MNDTINSTHEIDFVSYAKRGKLGTDYKRIFEGVDGFVNFTDAEVKALVKTAAERSMAISEIAYEAKYGETMTMSFAEFLEYSDFDDAFAAAIEARGSADAGLFKGRGAEYVEDFSDSEDAWEHALSCDPRVIAALHGLSADERAEAADEFGEGFMEAAYPKTPPPTAAVDAEKQLAASAFTGDDGYDWLTDGADDAYLVALNEEGVKAYVLEYGDIIWGGDAHLPRFEQLTVSEFFAASDFDAAVTAVTEAVKNAQGRMKESKIVRFLSGTVQVEVDLKNPPLIEGGIPAPRTWCQVLADDTNDGRGYDVDYTPFSSLGWIFNSANVRRAVIFGTYATRGEAWLASEAFNTIEAKRQRRIQG